MTVSIFKEMFLASRQKHWGKKATIITPSYTHKIAGELVERLRLWRILPFPRTFSLCRSFVSKQGQLKVRSGQTTHLTEARIIDTHVLYSQPWGCSWEAPSSSEWLQSSNGNVGDITFLLWTGSSAINYSFFSCWIHITMKASAFVPPANTRAFFLLGLSESHNSVLNLLGMNKYSVYNRARKCNYLRMCLSISALEARRETLTFGSVFREAPLLEGGAHVLEPNICFFILKHCCFSNIKLGAVWPFMKFRGQDKIHCFANDAFWELLKP